MGIFECHFSAYLETFPVHYHPKSDQYFDLRSLHRHNMFPAVVDRMLDRYRHAHQDEERQATDSLILALAALVHGREGGEKHVERSVDDG